MSGGWQISAIDIPWMADIWWMVNIYLYHIHQNNINHLMTDVPHPQSIGYLHIPRITAIPRISDRYPPVKDIQQLTDFWRKTDILQMTVFWWITDIKQMADNFVFMCDL